MMQQLIIRFDQSFDIQKLMTCLITFEKQVINNKKYQYQKILMKINFDQLFGVTGDQKRNYKKASHVSQASTSFDLQQPQIPQPQPPKTLPAPAAPLTSPKRTVNQTMRILQQNKKQQKYNWFIQSKLDDEQMSLNKSKAPARQLKKKEAEMLSARLAQPQVCHKKFCNCLCQTEVTRRLKEDHLGAFGVKRSLTQICQYETKNPSKLHETLHYQHKTRQFRNYELMLQYQQKSKTNQAFKYENPVYTTNYIPFYQRLSQQLQKRAKRQQFYDRNPIYSDHVVQFNPNTSLSKKSFMARTTNPAILPRSQKNQIKGTAQMRELQRLSSSLNRSVELDRVMNRSVEIVQEKEEKMIVKLVTLFDENGYFVVKPETIEQLDEKQFEIFCPLISRLQKSQQMPIAEFENKLRKYLKQMPKQQKLALRKHDIMKQKQNNIKIKQQKMSASGIYSQPSKTYRSRHNTGKDYLDKIKNFV